MNEHPPSRSLVRRVLPREGGAPGRWAKRARAVAGASCALVLLAGCGGSEDDGASPPAATETATTNGGAATEQAAEDHVITIVDYEYEVPASVPAGAEVTVRNEDSVNHTVTSDEEGRFDVDVEPGGEATFTVPDEPGDYGFFCRPHPYMTSTLVVG